MQEVTIFAAFFAGILSFLSPCVLPLVPIYISFMSGVSIEELQQTTHRQQVLRKTVITSCAFILGFSIVFVMLGATATMIGAFLVTQLWILTKIAGVIIIILGLYLLGLFKHALSFLNYEKRFHLQHVHAGVAGAFLLGLAFAFGWTPCTSPILGPILILAGGQGTVGKGMLLLSVYSLGLGIPFLLTSVATYRFFSILNIIKRHFQTIRIVSGVFLLLVGVLMFSGKFLLLNQKLIEWFPWLLKFS